MVGVNHQEKLLKHCSIRKVENRCLYVKESCLKPEFILYSYIKTKLLCISYNGTSILENFEVF